MVKVFSIGFKYKGFPYGWKSGELFRLPSTKSGKKYGLKKLSLIPVGNKKGYRCMRDKLTIEQLEEITGPINVKIETPKRHKDLPKASNSK